MKNLDEVLILILGMVGLWVILDFLFQEAPENPPDFVIEDLGPLGDVRIYRLSNRLGSRLCTSTDLFGSRIRRREAAGDAPPIPEAE
jgi:hypothetical protein